MSPFCRFAKKKKKISNIKQVIIKNKNKPLKGYSSGICQIFSSLHLIVQIIQFPRFVTQGSVTKWIQHRTFRVYTLHILLSTGITMLFLRSMTL